MAAEYSDALRLELAITSSPAAHSSSSISLAAGATTFIHCHTLIRARPQSQ